MSFFSDIFGAAVSAVSTIINVVVDVASSVIEGISKKFEDDKNKYKDIDIDALKRRRFEQLKKVNDEIIEIEKKARFDGKLSEDEKDNFDVLISKRSEIRKRIDAATEHVTATDMEEHSGDYDIKIVDPTNPNEFTREGGRVIMGKQCPDINCKRPMSIRWRTDVRNPQITDLFWGCTGFFLRNNNGQPVCNKTMRFSEADRHIFGRTGIPGMELPAESLNKIVLKPETSNHIKGKLQHAVDEENEDYLCPVHHEKMQLKTKKNASDLLDLYYFRCPRCDQMLKIKSATQLDAVLDSYNGSGMFSS